MDLQVIAAFAILVLTVLLLVLDVLSIDVIALVCLLALFWSGILNPAEALAGFSSNAVMSMVAVMVLGRGIARTDLMGRFARMVVSLAGRDRTRIVALVSAAVGLISAVMQNVGAAVLVLPGVLHVSRRERIPVSQLLMPIGFAAILGGTLTMVGSSALILVNDILIGSALAPYGLFSVTPVGIVLLAAGIGLFVVAGSRLLPGRQGLEEETPTQKLLIESWSLPFAVWHYYIPEGSALAGMTAEQSGIWEQYHLNVLGLSEGSHIEYAPWRETRFERGHDLAVLGEEADVRRFAEDYGLLLRDRLDRFRVLTDPTAAGFAEVIVPPRSELVGSTIRQFSLRRRYAVEPVLLYHLGEAVRGDFSDTVIAAGDIIVVHGLWGHIADIKSSANLALLTHLDGDFGEPAGAWLAVGCFALAIILTMFGLPISMAFLTGAAAMLVTRVLTTSEAYRAIDWKVVVFVAGLIPLGVAMQKTGAAALMAGAVMQLVHGHHPLVILTALAVLASVFSLFMSNVAATVILAPLAISIAALAGHDPRPLVLLVAVCAGNSFILPTHQVNAIYKTPGGYRNADYLRAGIPMTLLVLLVAVPMFYVLYW